MKIKSILFLPVLLASMQSYGQDVTFAQGIIDSLCSEHYHGRGYVNQGDRKASEFIKDKFIQAGLLPLKSEDYFHYFKLNVNTFPETVSISGTNLVPGIDFIVAPNCPTFYAEHREVILITEAKLTDKKTFKSLRKLDWSGKIPLIDTLPKSEDLAKKVKSILDNYQKRNPKTYHSMEVHKKLTWSVGRNQAEVGKIYVRPGALSDHDFIDIEVEARFIKNYSARNVVGHVRGTEQPDSFLFITGHYDHLGRMGDKAIMPGANDNASGIAMILDLANYYKNNPPRYTVVFVAFAAEEAGLVGSYNFVLDLKQFVTPKRIRFVINMDLMGSGQEGIMAVNGAVFEFEYNLLTEINTKNEHLPITKKRGKAANSDHYFFSEAGIPAFFFYLMGPYAHYHDVEDTAENLRLEEKFYNGAFLLIRDFANALMVTP